MRLDALFRRGAVGFRGHLPERLGAGEESHDLLLHLRDVLEAYAWVEYDERVALPPVFVDASDGAVVERLGVAFDEYLRPLQHDGEDVYNVLHRGVVEGHELPQ